MALTGFTIYYLFGSPAFTPEGIDELRVTQAQTAAFVGVMMVHVGFVFTARSIMGSAFTFSPFSNKWILGGIGVTVVLGVAIVYVPFLNVLFRTAPFPAEWWPPLLLALLPGFVAVEIEKLVRRLFRKRKS
jgi:magnesium-transporting ATPase (P-type)